MPESSKRFNNYPKGVWLKRSDFPITCDEGVQLVDIELIGHSPEWVHPDFNPEGIRVFYIDSEGEYISARVTDAVGCYRNAPGVPTHYMIIPPMIEYVPTDKQQIKIFT